MAIKIHRPTSAGRRFYTTASYEEITKKEPEKSLLAVKNSKAGRNAQGKVTVRHQGGGNRQKYRIIDFKRNKDNIPAKVVRHMIGDGKILGVSASNLEEAVRAENDGADYIGLGAVIPTGTKDDAEIVKFDEIRKIRDKVRIPIVIIGGLNEKTIGRFKGMDLDGIAVVSAVVASKDPEKSARDLKELWLS